MLFTIDYLWIMVYVWSGWSIFCGLWLYQRGPPSVPCAGPTPHTTHQTQHTTHHTPHTRHNTPHTTRHIPDTTHHTPHTTHHTPHTPHHIPHITFINIIIAVIIFINIIIAVVVFINIIIAVVVFINIIIIVIIFTGRVVDRINWSAAKELGDRLSLEKDSQVGNLCWGFAVCESFVCCPVWDSPRVCLMSS